MADKKYHKIPNVDPVSGGKLYISEVTGEESGIQIRGRFEVPVYARLDLRFIYAKSPLSRWQLYFEAINVLQRENASQLTPTLHYDSNADRPQLTESRNGGIPFFPSFGFRIRF